MTQLSNVNKVDPHTSSWWTLLKAWSSLHLGPVADVWLRVQSSHLSVFLMLTLCVLVVCRLFKHYTECHNHAHALNWSCCFTQLPTPWRHARLSDQIDGPRHLTAPRPRSYNRHVKCSLFNCAAIFWCAQSPLLPIVWLSAAGVLP